MEKYKAKDKYHVFLTRDLKDALVGCPHCENIHRMSVPKHLPHGNLHFTMQECGDCGALIRLIVDYSLPYHKRKVLILSGVPENKFSIGDDRELLDWIYSNYSHLLDGQEPHNELDPQPAINTQA